MDMKKLIESVQALEECPPMEGGTMPPAPMDQGDPVRMNVNISASGKEHVEDLIDMMKNAGLGNAKPVSSDMMPMRKDMERLRDIVDAPTDDPEIPGRDDVEGDEDLKAGLLGALAGGALGTAAGAATGATSALGAMGGSLGAQAGSKLARAAGKGLAKQVATGAIGNKIGTALGKSIPSAVGAQIGSAAQDRFRDKLRASVGDDPSIPGRDDVEGDTDLQAGVLGNLRTAAGQTLKHGGVGAGIGAALGGAAGMALGGPAGAAQGAAMGAGTGAALGGTAGRAAATAKMTKKELEKEGYENAPEEDYKDHEYMTKDLSGGINREKKAYKKAQDGDNAMSVKEEIKARLMAALSEKMDPVGKEDGDVNNDGKKNSTDEYLLKRRAAIAKSKAEKKKK